MDYHYRTKGGVCSRAINFTIENGFIKNIKFEGGCNGNAKGVSKLAEGMKAEDAANRLLGIKCGFKSSSCPDQLAHAIKDALSKGKN